MPEITLHPTYRSLNKPLTILGVERGLFFGALLVGAATFNLFLSLAGGIAIFGLLYSAARYITATDPQMLRLVINASRLRGRYDPAKMEPNRGDVIPDD